MKEQTTVTLQEVNNFVAAAFQKAALANDHATFTACLYRLREIYKEDKENGTTPQTA